MSSFADPADEVEPAVGLSAPMKLISLLRKSLLFTAFGLAILPSVLKLYETSHWFREGDVSTYDDAKDWFDNPALPFQQQMDSSKKLMRIYFFIFPYMFMALALVLANLLPNPKSSVTGKNPHRARVVGRSVLLRTVPFPGFLVRAAITPPHVSVGEILGVIVFLILNIGTILVRVRRSLPRGSRKNLYLAADGDAGKEDIDPISWEATEVWGKTLGVISILNLGWYLLMPMGRKSILLEALGLSWDRAVKYHRWAGYYTIGIMIAHGFMYIGVLVHGNGHPVYDPEGVMLKQNLLLGSCGECDDEQKHHLRVNIWGITTLVLVLTMTLFALPYFRRSKFEWFYYAHHLFILVLVFVCLHYSGSIIYLIPGVAIYSIDKLMGMLAYRKTGCARTGMVSSDVLEVAVALGPDTSYKAGQWVMVNVPSVSRLQWHPFSLTSSPRAHGNEVFFHLKEAGDWTAAVLRTVKSDGDGALPVRVQGFYGHDFVSDLTSKQSVVLVGGGIGVTPMMSIGLELVEANPNMSVTLLWVVRTVDEFGIFSTQLHEASQRHSNFHVKVWITLSRPEPKMINTTDIEKVEITNEDSDTLTPDEACDRVVNTLNASTYIGAPAHLPILSYPQSLSAKNKPFIVDNAGLGPGSNTIAMLLAMLLALTGYTTSVSINNKLEEEEGEGIEPEEKFTMFSASLALVLVLAAFVSVLLFRAFAAILPSCCQPAQLARNLDSTIHRFLLKHDKFDLGNTEHTEMTVKTPNSSLHETASSSSGGSGGSNEGSHEILDVTENGLVAKCSAPCSAPSQGRDIEVYRSMLNGRLGGRPDMKEEFREIAKACGEVNGAISDVGVLACGPQAMTRSINEICNGKSSGFSWGHHNEDGTDAYFVFTEEDWEW